MTRGDLLRIIEKIEKLMAFEIVQVLIIYALNQFFDSCDIKALLKAKQIIKVIINYKVQKCQISKINSCMCITNIAKNINESSSNHRIIKDEKEQREQS